MLACKCDASLQRSDHICCSFERGDFQAAVSVEGAKHWTITASSPVFISDSQIKTSQFLSAQTLKSTICLAPFDFPLLLFYRQDAMPHLFMA